MAGDINSLNLLVHCDAGQQNTMAHVIPDRVQELLCGEAED